MYHGTTAEAARGIHADGFLRPRGLTEGNWAYGLFGGNPSNPDLVYVANNVKTAIEYAKQICGGQKTSKAAVVSAIPDWKSAVPDEDVVFNLLNNKGTGILTEKVWEAYAYAFGFAGTQEAKQDWENQSDKAEISDSGLAERMKETALRLQRVLSENDLESLTRDVGTVAFSKPLRVVDVMYFKA